MDLSPSNEPHVTQTETQHRSELADRCRIVGLLDSLISGFGQRSVIDFLSSANSSL
jgi:hypothetical protein